MADVFCLQAPVGRPKWITPTLRFKAIYFISSNQLIFFLKGLTKSAINHPAAHTYTDTDSATQTYTCAHMVART